MAAPDMRERILALHGRYVDLTGYPLNCTPPREWAWFEWIKGGFTAADLEIVIRHLNRGIRAGQRYPAALRFSNLIGDLERFEEDLAMAKAVSRKSAPTARAQILSDTGRPPDSDAAPAREISEILKSPEFAAFVELKKTL